MRLTHLYYCTIAATTKEKTNNLSYKVSNGKFWQKKLTTIDCQTHGSLCYHWFILGLTKEGKPLCKERNADIGNHNSKEKINPQSPQPKPQLYIQLVCRATLLLHSIT